MTDTDVSHAGVPIRLDYKFLQNSSKRILHATERAEVKKIEDGFRKVLYQY